MIGVGTKFGPYEILSAIGAGGMGEVYRARDTRLDRIVAIKILPDHHAARPDLRERFEREARTVASLNHPHICTLYDVGHEDGTDFLIMEYLEGETLAERLKKGPLPLDQVLQYAIEISDALDKAHRKGITHRDLKPGNIMLTKSGTKLLDFGLAKLKQEVAPANVQLSQLPTANDPLTVQGTIVGTLQYMAPEQLEGKGVDARTDIFAFGVVVYEMATGKKAFDGESSASVIGAILKDNPPPISSLQPMTPPALDRVVKKCLVKEPEKRWQVASDLCDELKWIAEAGSEVTSAPATTAKGSRALGRRPIIVGLGALLFGAVIASLAIWNLKPSPPALPAPVSRSVFSLPPGDRLARTDLPAVALSPDGSHMVYVVGRGSTQQLYLRAINSFEAKPMPGTEGAVAPFFSPDSQWIGFFADGELKKISINGGASVSLCAAPVGIGVSASWGTDGTIVFQNLSVGGLWQVSAAGGTPRRLNTLGKGESSNRWPEFLPGAKAVLFAAGISTTGWATPQLTLYWLDKGERRNLISGGTRPYYAPTGHLLYVQSGTLTAVPFDLQRMSVTGAPVPVVEGVVQSVVTGVAQYSASENGSLVYVPGSILGGQNTLVWVDRRGAEQPLRAPPHGYRSPRVSPDGKRVALVVDEIGAQAWIYDLARDTLTRLTFEAGGTTNVAWTRDGKRLAFDSGGTANMFWQAADGSDKAERLTTSGNRQLPTSWSPDGQRLAYMELDPMTSYDIWVLGLSDRKAQPFLRTPAYEGAPQFSPDGRWLAYASNESGRYEIYVQPFPGPGGKYQISTDGATEPVWNPNGRELFFRSGAKMMAVDITSQPNFAAGKPRMLFEGPYLSLQTTIPSYDVSPDGQRFLMLKSSEQTQAITQINVVQNWFEELKQKVPAGKK